VEQLQGFALGHDAARVREDGVHLQQPEPDGETHGLGVEIIAHENGRAVAPQGVRGIFAPAERGVVQHVVVQQRGRVNVLTIALARVTVWSPAHRSRSGGPRS
jgi:hypothetical protein